MLSLIYLHLLLFYSEIVSYDLVVRLSKRLLQRSSRITFEIICTLSKEQKNFDILDCNSH